VKYLIDTNVISELRKGQKCNPNVAAWFASIVEPYISVLVLGEIRKGVERARTNDPARARALEQWLDATLESFGDRVLPVDQAIAEEWGRMSARRPVSTVDALLAATARVHRMTLATRNVTDVADLGADVVNPFAFLPSS
jgi:predicted nucleic acid-binding protein